jgi:methylated-DNA-[protein]-cysteine S-methyltransferase
MIPTTSPTVLEATTVETPIGPLTLVASDRAVTGLYFAGDRRAADARARSSAPDGSILGRAEAALDAYFAGRASRFELPLAPLGTDFQRAVWAALVAIPYGATATYADIARAVGRPDAVRAVGAANGRNPISVIVPCHRVIGSDGSLTGYAGGLDRKAWLLTHEARFAARPR